MSEYFDTFRKDVILHCHLSQILQDSLYFDEYVMHFIRLIWRILKCVLVNLNNDLPPVLYYEEAICYRLPKDHL